METHHVRIKMTFYSIYQSPLGSITLTSDGVALTGLYFEGETDTSSIVPKALDVFCDVKAWLDGYFVGKDLPITFPIRFTCGTAFSLTVWELLREIPYGKTVSYKELANKVACKLGVERMSAQAVGNAVGKNPISIIVPCHRVIGSNGKLVGYRGGLDKKEYLLRLEQNIQKEVTI